MKNITLKCSVQKLKAEKLLQQNQKLEKILFKSKRLHKSMKTSRLDAKKLIRNAIQNMNYKNSQKYELAPNTI